jgi:hypothetical protein
MKDKICSKCNVIKPRDSFQLYLTGKNKGSYSTWCKSCKCEYGKTWRLKRWKDSPWEKKFHNINNRCTYKLHHYYKKGIKNFMTVEDIHYLWNRDNAEKMIEPSIDRIDSNGDYTLSNCRFLELEENKQRRGRDERPLCSA